MLLHRTSYTIFTGENEIYLAFPWPMSELPDIVENDAMSRENIVLEELPETNTEFGMPSLLESPNFGLSRQVDDNQSDDGRPFDGMPQSKPIDLRQSASQNFSSDSLNGSEFGSFPPLVNNYNLPPANFTRRFSTTSSTGSPVLPPYTTMGSAQLTPGSTSRTPTTRPRPKSAIFMTDSISEHGSQGNILMHNSPRSRNSVGNIPKTAYLPTTFGPPLAPTNGYVSKPSSPSRSNSPTRGRHQYGSKSPVRRSSSPSKANPFNFKPQEIMLNNNNSNNSLSVKPAHRKGHKYKHSSISMNLFQEPVQTQETAKQLLEIPDLYPIPNIKESFASINKNQKLKLSWSVFHFSLSLFVFTIGFHVKLSAFSTLAHLIFYDALGSILIVMVDIMSNFEVWNSPSIAYPFGLGRLEVLVGFALSASLIMVGFDLISHFAEESIVELMSSPEEAQHSLSHHIHDEQGHLKNWFIYEFMLLVTIVVTLVTSNVILVGDKINDMISDDTTTKTNKGSILDEEVKRTNRSWIKTLQTYIRAWAKNPTHLLTLSYSLYLIIYPLLAQMSEIGNLNEIASLAAALMLCYIGWKLVTTLGGILLCSYPHSNYDYHLLRTSITQDILSLDFFKQNYNISKLFITKFNYELFVVGINIEMRGATSDEDSRMRFEVHRIITRQIKHHNYTSPNQQIEITIDINRV